MLKLLDYDKYLYIQIPTMLIFSSSNKARRFVCKFRRPKRDRIKRLKVRWHPLLPRRRGTQRRGRGCRGRHCPGRQGSSCLLRRRSCNVLITPVLQLKSAGVHEEFESCTPALFYCGSRSLPLQLPVQSEFCRNMSAFIQTRPKTQKIR